MERYDIESIAVEVGRQLAYTEYYKGILDPSDTKYIALSPQAIQEIVRIIHDSGILQKLAEESMELAKDAIKMLILEYILDYLRKRQSQQKAVLDMSYFKKIAIKGIQTDGKPAIYTSSEPIKLHPYQNIALFGIEGTPVLDFRDMDPDEACFKLEKGSALFLKNLKIVKYTTQKLAEGDGRVIYDNRDVIIENYEPPEDEEEVEVFEEYLEIEFL